MRILVACEFSGVVRDAFIRAGHDAYSCDLLPSESDFGPHIQGDVRNWLKGAPTTLTVPNGETSWHGGKNDPGHKCVDYHTISDSRKPWDAMLAFPDCTFLCGSGLHWNNRGRGWEKTEAALDFVRLLLNSNIKKVAIENPVGIIGTKIRKASQTVQPYEFGDNASKRTCLWLKGLPSLVKNPAKRITGRIVEWPRGSGKMVERWDNQTDSGQNKLPPSKKRASDRSRTYPGIAQAMADQWGR